MGRKKKRSRLGLVSLGCAKNEVDAERILGSAAEKGWIVCADPAAADVVVVNTCGFIAAAREECRVAIEDMLDLKRTGRCRAVIVSGCLAQRSGGALAQELPEVDAWVGLAEARNIPDIAAELLRRSTHDPCVRVEAVPSTFGEEGARLRITPPHYAYLRITEGCDNGCSYCAIPLIRGPLRSKPLDVCLAEARQLADTGCRELILIGQDTTNYGRDLDAGSLPLLLERLAALDAFHWLRVLYCHPAHFDDAVLEAFAATPRLCAYVDLPIQHASDPVLQRMGRGTTRAAMLDLVHRLRERIPGVALRTTVLVGYPGETEADVASLLDFMAEARFDHLGAFVYSEEEGTRAVSEGPAVPDDEREERLDAVMTCQQDIAFARAQGRVGSTVEVVIDGAVDAGAFAARSAAEAPDVDPLIFVHGKALEPGAFLDVTIMEADGYDLFARPAGAK
ncbi:30S ribosomal protein S12 methylthiotransferase RimO [bacterium]|nr:30S ribosomal protein S12 methylthiotransferase RimO [bacterium]